jgi:hypothetical protein
MCGLWFMPTMIDMKASQVKLETLLTIWLLSDNDDNSDEADMSMLTVIVALDG